MDSAAREVDEFEALAIRAYLSDAGQVLSETWTPFVTRWSRVRLPNGQIGRSKWKESLKPIERLRCSRNVKVHFYLMFKVGEVRKPQAVVSLYGEHHQQLYNDSSKSYVTMQHLGNSGVRVIDIDSILAAVMLAPDEQYANTYHDGSELNRWYLMEKPGLKLMAMMGIGQELVPEV
ncbi:hypothetical protein DFH07DRAFT_727206 [Mycena maculata]|uniref:Uncharacterized protein n=1 Tax=Mycena maculata TaxID=230809 RepID=A0AAD7KF73_9AGAR|nr:hypothetical protein DFH07DRAFT_727206 [Mycena maculata]